MLTTSTSFSLLRRSLALCLFFVCTRAMALDPVETTNNLAPSRPPDAESNGERPLWEVGVGVGGVYSQDYPGSKQGKFWFSQFLLLSTAERFSNLTKKAARARVGFMVARGKFNISGAGSFPSSSDGGAREGMPKLQWLGEVGPAFSVRIFQTENKTQLKANLPLRASGSTDLHEVAWRGFMLAPNLVLDVPLGPKSFNFFSSLGADFADRSRMGYYYDVDPQYVTATRGYYHAKGGFLRATASVGLSYDLPKANMSFYTILSHDSFAGAANENSPLIEEKQSWSGGVALTWRFAASKVKVKAN